MKVKIEFCFFFVGIQGRRIYKHKGIEIWSRPITPIYQTYYSYAVAFVNRRTDGTPSDVAVTLRELGLQSPTGYRVEVQIEFLAKIIRIINQNFNLFRTCTKTLTTEF
jgi:hypothetical protein